MSLHITKSKLKPKLLSYLRRVEQKKTPIIVTDRGHPVARILPMHRREKNLLKELAGSVLKYDDPLAPVGEEDWDLKP